MKRFPRLALSPLAPLAGALLTLAPAAAPAQQPAQARWNVDWGEQHCTLTRSPAPGVPITFGLRTVPGTFNRQLILMSEEWPEPPFASGTGVTVTLGTPAAAIEPELRAGRRSNSRFIVMERLGEDFLDRLAQATEIRVARGGSQIIVPLPGARAAVAALRACEADALREWGVDDTALDALRERPQLTQIWVQPEDYPSEALRANARGLVVIRLAVDARGRVTECAVVGRSGNDALDDATCRRARARATYRPAIGPDGQPTAARIITYVRWWIED